MIYQIKNTIRIISYSSIINNNGRTLIIPSLLLPPDSRYSAKQGRGEGVPEVAGKILKKKFYENNFVSPCVFQQGAYLSQGSCSCASNRASYQVYSSQKIVSHSSDCTEPSEVWLQVRFGFMVIFYFLFKFLLVLYRYISMKGQGGREKSKKTGWSLLSHRNLGRHDVAPFLAGRC